MPCKIWTSDVFNYCRYFHSILFIPTFYFVYLYIDNKIVSTLWKEFVFIQKMFR
jgi:hypothetical protein